MISPEIKTGILINVPPIISLGMLADPPFGIPNSQQSQALRVEYLGPAGHKLRVVNLKSWQILN